MGVHRFWAGGGRTPDYVHALRHGWSTHPCRQTHAKNTTTTSVAAISEGLGLCFALSSKLGRSCRAAAAAAHFKSGLVGG